MMTKATAELARIIRESKDCAVIAIVVLGAGTFLMREVEIDEEAGLLIGKMAQSWPDLRTPGSDDAVLARTFTCRLELIAGYFA